MKKRVLSLILALSMVLSLAATASDALGWELHRSVTTLGPGTTLTQQLLWGDSKSDYRREFYLTYTPNSSVHPQVAYGSTVLSTNTVTALARSIESTGKRVLGGANGDYFVMATGAPLGILVTDGVLRSSSSYHYALGFDAEGKAVIGKPNTQVWTDFRGCHLLVSGGYNKSRTASGGMTLFSADFGSTTRATAAGIDVILRPVTVPEGFTFPALEQETVTIDPATGLAVDPTQPPAESAETTPAEGAETADGEAPAESETAVEGSESLSAGTYEQVTRYTQASLDALKTVSESLESAPAALGLSGSVDCVVVAVTENASSSAIPAGCFVLSLDEQSGSDFHKNLLKDLQIGEKLTISVTTEDENFQTVVSAMGAYTLLLKGGEVQEGLSTSADPRTAVGVKEDGTVILYALDGRRSGYSVGGSVKQVAQRLKELGCVDAALFDGGGSTTLGTTDAVGDSFSVVNKPSEGSQRAVTNGLFFVSTLTATGVPGSLYVESAEEILLSGAQTTLSAQLIDTGYYPMKTAPEGVTYSATAGSVMGNVFTAGAEAGETVITGTSARMDENGLTTFITGQTLVTTVATPHGISAFDEATGQEVTALSLDPGESVNLTATATWRKMTLKSRDECFTWAVTPQLGTIDASGTLTAGTQGGSGAVTVTAGGKTVTIPLTVGGHVTELERCDSAQGFASETAQLTLDTQNVKYGTGALRVDYPAGRSEVEIGLTIPEGDSYFGFWLLGSGEGLKVSARFRLADGTTEETLYCDRAYSGWKQLLGQSGSAAGVEAIVIESAGAGTLWLDQMVSANDTLYDTQPPTVTLEVKNGTLTGVFSDNVDRELSPDRVTLTRDGQSMNFTLRGDTLTAPLPADDGQTHRYSLTVSDASGNRTRAGLTLTAEVAGSSPFVDTQGHWAEEYAVYLYENGVIEGSFNQIGRIFEPGKNITRAEFATMLSRWLGLELSQYAEVELPFVDAAEIPAWALNSVKALYSLGIFTGSAEVSGLYALADQPLSRAQAMTMLGRVQPKGYGVSQEVFEDHQEVPSWAKEYVYTLVAQGVVSGFNGLLRPGDPVTRGEVAKLLTTMW